MGADSESTKPQLQLMASSRAAAVDGSDERAVGRSLRNVCRKGLKAKIWPLSRRLASACRERCASSAPSHANPRTQSGHPPHETRPAVHLNGRKRRHKWSALQPSRAAALVHLGWRQEIGRGEVEVSARAMPAGFMSSTGVLGTL